MESNLKIRFGTDGWRAIIAREFTVANVARVAEATGLWLKQNYDQPQVVIGHDCRFAGPMFADTAADVLASMGVKVLLANGYVTTPMVSLGTVETGSSVGIVITASHNPAGYNGFKLKGSYGGPLLPKEIGEIEALIPDQSSFSPGDQSLETHEKSGQVEAVDLEKIYLDRVRNNFDLAAIQNSGMKLAYDAMYGSGQRILAKLLPNAALYRNEHHPLFPGIAPEPIMKNLHGFAEFIQQAGDIDSGLATDGDADRIGLMDGQGKFIDSHHIMLLLIHYLSHYKKWTGKVVTGFSTTVKIARLCEHYGLELDWVPIGFKHVCATMLKEDVLMGGEESGGIAVKGFIPERDGIWNGLVIWEFMALSGKTLNDLIQEVYDITGPFAFERIDLRISEEQKQAIIAKCKAGEYQKFGDYQVQRTDTLDGFKYFLSDEEWVMIRPSGTEPVLRTYAEAADQATALKILEATHNTILA